MKDYFKGNERKAHLVEERKKEFDEVIERRKISIDDQITVTHYLRALNDYWTWKYFALKKDDEPRHFQGNALTESRRDYTKEQLTKIYKHKGYECQTVTLPWFIVWDMYDQLARKYFKGPAHKEEIEIQKNAFYFSDNFKAYSWLSPSNNPVYKWIKDWEYNIHPMEFKNLKEFMRARIKVRKKYSKLLVEARVEEKIQEEKRKEQLKKEEERAKILKKQARNEALRDKRYESIEMVAKDPAVYIICERKKIFTKVKNKCNALYVGETVNIAKRASAYSDLNRSNNELVNKLENKLKKPREDILKKLNKNVRVRILRSKTISDDAHRQEIEGYLINRLNPLLNTSKRNGFFNRSFLEKKPSDEDYWADVEEGYRWERYQTENGESKTIFHVGDKKWVKRESEDGEEAMEIQFQRSYSTWIRKHNLKNRADEWKEDQEAFWKSINEME